jgi:hypothetical protein
VTWFFVDDHLHDHRKARKAGPEDIGLWTLAGSWCADNLTDGFIPSDVAIRWVSGDSLSQVAGRLVACGLWHVAEVDGETGWQFHDWDDYQQTREQVLDKREKRARAGRLGGKASGRSRSAPSRPEALASTGAQASGEASASTFVEPPSPPLPSLTRVPTEPAGSADAQPAAGGDAEALFDDDTQRQPPATPPKPKRAPTLSPDIVATAVYDHANGMIQYKAVRPIAVKALALDGATAETVTAAMIGIYDAGKPITLATVGQALMGCGNGSTSRPPRVATGERDHWDSGAGFGMPA